jgi:hypothetical protein
MTPVKDTSSLFVWWIKEGFCNLKNADKTYDSTKIKIGAEAPIFKLSSKYWCLGPESNRYSHEDRGILSPFFSLFPPFPIPSFYSSNKPLIA